MSTTARRDVALWEATRHARALDDWEAIEGDRALVRLVDQILYRFIRLQDAIGERLAPGTLNALAEPCEGWPMRNRLNRLEKLGYLNVDAWLGRRDVHNRLAHEYPDTPAARFALLAVAIQATRELLTSYRSWQDALALAGIASEPKAAI
jgi:hypothetical protein